MRYTLIGYERTPSWRTTPRVRQMIEADNVRALVKYGRGFTRDRSAHGCSTVVIVRGPAETAETVGADAVVAVIADGGKVWGVA